MWSLREEFGGDRAGEEGSVWLVFPTHAEVRYRFFFRGTIIVSSLSCACASMDAYGILAVLLLELFFCSPGRAKSVSLVVLHSLTLTIVWDAASDAGAGSAISCFVDERKLSTNRSSRSVVTH